MDDPGYRDTGCSLLHQKAEVFGAIVSRSMMNGVKVIILIILTVLVGCDWFDEQLEVNLPPETELLECGGVQGVTEGDDVRFVWSGSDAVPWCGKCIS